MVIILRAVVRFSAIGSGSQFGGKSGGPLLPREIPPLGQFDRHRERLSFPGLSENRFSFVLWHTGERFEPLHIVFVSVRFVQGNHPKGQGKQRGETTPPDR